MGNAFPIHKYGTRVSFLGGYLETSLTLSPFAHTWQDAPEAGDVLRLTSLGPFVLLVPGNCRTEALRCF